MLMKFFIEESGWSYETLILSDIHIKMNPVKTEIRNFEGGAGKVATGKIVGDKGALYLDTPQLSGIRCQSCGLKHRRRGYQREL